MLIVEIYLCQADFAGYCSVHKVVKDPSTSPLDSLKGPKNVINDFPAPAIHS
jgi:hypothetical protein